MTAVQVQAAFEKDTGHKAYSLPATGQIVYSQLYTVWLEKKCAAKHEEICLLKKTFQDFFDKADKITKE